MLLPPKLGGTVWWWSTLVFGKLSPSAPREAVLPKFFAAPLRLAKVYDSTRNTGHSWGTFGGLAMPKNHR